MARIKHETRFYGTTTVGEKGQAVIPIEARDTLEIKSGDKLLVFGMGNDSLIFSKASSLEKMAQHLAQHLQTVQDALKQSK